jgi:hypothetical protein
MASDWWGYETQLKHWVYLNREIINNQPDYGHLSLVFVDCQTEQILDVSRDEWKEPRFVYEGQMTKIYPNIGLNELQGFKSKLSSYKNLVSSYGFPSDKKPSVGLNELIPTSSSINFIDEPLSPEQIRTKFAKEYSDDAWSEVISYVALMVKLDLRHQGKCNEYITQLDLWHKFPNIRAMNDHGYAYEIEGITPTAYRLVCEVINLHNIVGAPLQHSRKY